MHWVKIKVYMDLWYKWYSTFSQHCHVIKTCRLNSWNIICLLVDTHWIHGQLTNIMDNSWLCDGWDWSSIGIMLMEYLSRIGWFVSHYSSNTQLTHICWHTSTDTQPTFNWLLSNISNVSAHFDQHSANVRTRWWLIQSTDNTDSKYDPLRTFSLRASK